MGTDMSKNNSQAIKIIQESKKDLEFLPTGYSKLDDMLDGGFLKKELVVVGAPTGKGKSYVAGTIFKNIAMKGFKSAYFSLEISVEMVVSRLLSEMSGVAPTRIISKELDQDEAKRVEDAELDLIAFDEFMDYYDDLYVLAEIEKEIRDKKYDFVVIDFVQNVMAKGDEYERLSYISLALQKLAKETNCTILILSQLSNMMAREKAGSAVEYRGSGSIATVCDLGFFIEPDPDQMFNSSKFILRLRKNRRGVSGLAFDFYFRNGKIFEA
jgi:replicative DNA helicase